MSSQLQKNRNVTAFWTHFFLRKKSFLKYPECIKIHEINRISQFDIALFEYRIFILAPPLYPCATELWSGTLWDFSEKFGFFWFFLSSFLMQNLMLNRMHTSIRRQRVRKWLKIAIYWDMVKSTLYYELSRSPQWTC